MPRSKVKCPNPGNLVVNLKRHPDKSLSNACELQLVGAGGATDLTAQAKKRTTFEKLPPGGYNLWVRPAGEEVNFDIDEKIGLGPENSLGHGLQNRGVTIRANATTIHHYKFKPYELRVEVVDDLDPSKKIQHVTVTAEGGPKELKKVTAQDGLANFGFVPRTTRFRVHLALRSEDQPKYLRPLPELNAADPRVVGSQPYQLRLVPVVTLYLRLLYKDPENNERPFPPGLNLKLRFTDASPNMDVRTGADGHIFLPKNNANDPDERPIVERRHRGFTIILSDNHDRFVRVEPDGASAKQSHLETVVPDPSQPAPAAAPAPPYTREYGLKPARWFQLPRQWPLSDSTWEVRNHDHYNNYNFTQLENEATKVGTAARPVILVLDPHWQYLRFVYFDRWLEEQAPISIPPLALAGHFPAPTALPEPTPRTKALWNINTAKDGFATVLCLPWIIQVGGHKPDNNVQINFETAADTFIETAQDRKSRKVVVGLQAAVKDTPNATRFRYYDLPAIWKSRRYFCRLGNDANRFAGLSDRNAHPTSADEPLTFSLDDIVLTDHTLTPIAWVPNDRAAIFSHLFSNKDSKGKEVPDLTNIGLYKPDSDNNDNPWYFTKVPQAADIETNRNYIAEYPHWTRLVVAKGNLHSVFDERTSEAAIYDNQRVVGARAGVRLLDVAANLPWARPANMGGAVQAIPVVPTAPAAPPAEQVPTWNYGAATTSPSPPCDFDNGGTDVRPARLDSTFFSVQPFFWMKYGKKYTAAYDGVQEDGIGRFDMSLLRCCHVRDGNEVAINFHFFRYSLEFINPGNPLFPTAQALNLRYEDGASPGRAMSQEEFTNRMLQNVSNRWNGNDSVNTERAVIRARDANPPARIPRHVEVLWFAQKLARASAQFHVYITNLAGSRDERAADGRGRSSPHSYQDYSAINGNNDGYAAAHEAGHMDGLQDEYNERWNAESFGQLSFNDHVPGDPYEPDGRIVEFQGAGSGMMNGNQTMRNRYFWHAAEWIAHICQAQYASTPDFRVQHGKYKEYWVPHHATAGRTFAFWPVSDPQVNFSPSAGQRGRYGLFLYTLGKDHYSQKLLKGGPFDGILVVRMLLKVRAPGEARIQGTRGRADGTKTLDLSTDNRPLDRVVANEWVLITAGGTQHAFELAGVDYSHRKVTLKGVFPPAGPAQTWSVEDRAAIHGVGAVTNDSATVNVAADAGVNLTPLHEHLASVHVRDLYLRVTVSGLEYRHKITAVDVPNRRLTVEKGYPAGNNLTWEVTVGWAEEKLLLQAISAGVRRVFNHRWYVAGTGAALAPAYEFKRCLIHFSPRFLVDGRPGSAGIEAVHGFHFDLDVRRLRAAPVTGRVPEPNTDWPNAAPDRTLRLEFRPQKRNQDLEQGFNRRFPEMFGVLKEPGKVKPEDLQTMVDEVLNNASVHTI